MKQVEIWFTGASQSSKFDLEDEEAAAMVAALSAGRSYTLNIEWKYSGSMYATAPKVTYPASHVILPFAITSLWVHPLPSEAAAALAAKLEADTL